MARNRLGVGDGMTRENCSGQESKSPEGLVRFRQNRSSPAQNFGAPGLQIPPKFAVVICHLSFLIPMMRAVLFDYRSLATGNADDISSRSFPGQKASQNFVDRRDDSLTVKHVCSARIGRRSIAIFCGAKIVVVAG